MHTDQLYQNGTFMTPIPPRAPAHPKQVTSPRIRHLVLALAVVAIASFGCAKEEQDTWEQHLSRANDYSAAQQWDKAETEHRQVLRLAPENPAALRQLGMLYLDRGQTLQAYPLLKKISELQPDDAEIQVKIGTILLSGGLLAEARDAARQVLDKHPDNEQALLLFANASGNPDDIEDARKFIQTLRDNDRDRPRYHLALGALDLRQNKPARAETEFKAALDLDPKSSETNAALGMFYWTRNQVKEAGQAFKTAADLAPPRSPKRIQYADFLIKTGEGAAAKSLLEDINRAAPDYLPPRVFLMKMACTEHQGEDCIARVQNILSQDPINYDALFVDGILNLRKGDAATAMREFEYLSNTYTQNPQVRYQLALAYLLYAKSAGAAQSRRAVESAESRLHEAVKLDPSFEQAILLLAELKIRKGIPAAAVDLLAPLTKERPQIAQAHYLLATAYLAQKKGGDALAVYRQMTELFPKDPQPPFLVGLILLAQGQQSDARSDARKAFERSIEIDPDYLPPLEKLVDLDIADKHYVAALARVEKQIEKNPNLAQLWGLKGKILFEQRDFTHAEADLLKAVELDPKLEAAYELLAQIYVVSNRQEEAIAKLNAFVEKNKTVPALMQLAQIQIQQKNFAAARDAYENLLSVAPNSLLALNNLAVLYSERLGQLDKAYDLAKRGREAAPNEPQLADTLGWILFKKGDYDNALRLLQESAGKLPNSANAQFHSGMAHYMMGEEGPARLALQKAVDATAYFPEKDEARQRLALLAIDVGAGNPGVRTELENYLRKQPNDPAALMRLGEVQQRDGAVDQAVKTYEKVVAENPLHAPATRQLALLYGQLSTDMPKAYELVTKARQAYPDDPVIAKTLGILNYRRGYHPQSVELLKEAAAKRRDDAELFYYLGEVHHKLKQWDECKGVLERALTLNLSPGLADDARRALADCSEPAPG
jgi:tetratricopeptide (TPR) repeat protein